jgi:ATP-dependent RNA helicase DeaD
VHRIGRVGRAGREGVAVTLADPRESRLLQHFERHTKGKIEVAHVPTVADLRARRLEMLRAMLQEAIVEGGLDTYRVCVETLAQEHDLMNVALAAVKLAHRAAGGDPEGDDDDVRDYSRPAQGRDDRRDRRDPRDGRQGPPPPPARAPAVKPARDERPAAKTPVPPPPKAAPKPPKPAKAPAVAVAPPPPPSAPVAAPAAAPAGDQTHEAHESHAAPPAEAPAGAPDVKVGVTQPAVPGISARVYVGMGRLGGLRPQDLVTAIVRGASIKGNDIGTIEIADKYSIVELPEPLADQVVTAMSATPIAGHKVIVRRFVEKKR